MCQFWELSCKIGEVASEATHNIIAEWAYNIIQDVSATLLKVGTVWTGVGTPRLGGADSAVGFVHSTTHILVVALAVASLFVAGIHLALSRRGETAMSVLQGLLALAVVSGASVGVGQLLVDASDAFSTWVIGLAVDGDAGKFGSKILSVTSVTGSLGLTVLIVGGLGALVANLVQIGLMFIRSAMLILLVGIMPLAAGAYSTKWGRGWLWKIVAWFFAFLMFKPAASIIYAVAIRLVQGDSWSLSNGEDLTSFVMGVVMLILAVLSLPALVTFMVPATEALSAGGGGAAGAGAVLATGAMTVARVGAATASGGATAAAGAGGATGAASSAGAGGASGVGASGGARSIGAGSAGSAGGGATRTASSGASQGSNSSHQSGPSGADGASGRDGSSGPSGAPGRDSVDSDMGGFSPTGGDVQNE
ncbi:MAG: collagen-like protein [Actinomycetaceae bacterium]|jgi:type IV secretion system protein TrbL|nr:collagen-like protein [Actinomycetaceae bacterium]